MVAADSKSELPSTPAHVSHLLLGSVLLSFLASHLFGARSGTDGKPDGDCGISTGLRRSVGRLCRRIFQRPAGAHAFSSIRTLYYRLGRPDFVRCAALGRHDNPEYVG